MEIMSVYKFGSRVSKDAFKFCDGLIDYCYSYMAMKIIMYCQLSIHILFN